MTETREVYNVPGQTVQLYRASWLTFQPHATADAEEQVVNAAKAYADAYLAHQCGPTAETAGVEQDALDALLSATWQLQAQEELGDLDDVPAFMDLP